MILIRKVAEPFGWLGNMAAFPVTWKEKTYRTTEALFQVMRFEDEEVIEAIRSAKSPMTAKMVAKKHRSLMVAEPMGSSDIDNMRWVLRLKLEQHPQLKQELLDTGEEEIVEDCTKRPRGSGLFWGAAFKNSEWVGQNMLGHLWMELREEVKAEVGVPNRPDVQELSLAVIAA
jgi:ribA/ribD-fused uncharacterized protein